MTGRRQDRSRNGCAKCKQRKVRCGEQRPACSACTRLSLECVYYDGRKPPPQPPVSLKEHRGRARRSHYLIRFVDCNNTTADRVNSFSNSQNEISRNIECSMSPPAPSHESLRNDSETRPALPLTQVEGRDKSQSLVSDNELLGYQAAKTQRIEQGREFVEANEPNLQSFFDDSNPTFTSDVTMQFFDAFDHSFWSEPLLNVVGGWDHDSQGGFMNDFDLTDFAGPLPPLRQVSPSRDSATPASVLNADTGVQISTGDHSLIQHFLTRMKRFSTKLLKSSEEDINSAMFSNLGLFNAQLFHAMLAFAALHRAQTQDNLYSGAEARYQRAIALLFEDENAHSHLDVTISTVWFLLQYELLLTKGIKRFCNLLAHLAHVLDAHPAHKGAEGLSNFEARTLISIAAYDLRAMTSGGNGGHILRCLENFLPLRVLLNEPASTFNGGPLAPILVSVPPGTRIDHNGILRLRLRCDIVHGRILMLSPTMRRADGDEPLSEDHPEWIAIRKSLAEQHEIFQRCPDTITGFPVQVATGNMSQSSYELGSRQCTHLLALSSLYAAFLDYHHAHVTPGFPKYSTNVSPHWPTMDSHTAILGMEECSARIVRISWFVRETRKLSPQSVWPSLLFAAGVASVDGIHRTWVLNALKETETWATHFLQTRILLEAVYKNQSLLKPGEIVDIIHLQAATTGSFII